MAGSEPLLVVAAELAQSTTAIPVSLGGRAVAQLRQLAAGGVVEADLRAVWAWASESSDADAVWLRDHGHVEWSALSRTARWTHRLRLARAWEARGRTGAAPEVRGRDRPRVRAAADWLATAIDGARSRETVIDTVAILDSGGG
jgi:hypothetical protein